MITTLNILYRLTPSIHQMIVRKLHSKVILDRPSLFSTSEHTKEVGEGIIYGIPRVIRRCRLKAVCV